MKPELTSFDELDARRAAPANNSKNTPNFNNNAHLSDEEYADKLVSRYLDSFSDSCRLFSRSDLSLGRTTAIKRGVLE